MCFVLDNLLDILSYKGVLKIGLGRARKIDKHLFPIE